MDKATEEQISLEINQKLSEQKGLIEGFKTPIITSVAVGFLLAFNQYFLDDRTFKNTFFLKKQAMVADSIVHEFSIYRTSLHELIRINNRSELGKSKANDDEYQIEYVKLRNTAKQDLLSAFNSVILYFDQSLVSKIERFKKWDDEQYKVNIKDITPWRVKEKEITIALKKELTK